MASRKDTKKPRTPKSKSPQKRTSQSDSPSHKPTDSPKSKVFSDLGRRLRDLCATWHDSIQKWGNLNSLGTNIANKLMNLQLQKQYSDAEDANSVTVLSDMSEAATSELQDEIVKTLQELSTVLQKMAGLLQKLEVLSKNFQAVKELKYLKGCEENDGETECVFQTWSPDDFCKASDKLLSMYKQELALKERLFPSFTTTSDRNILMVFLSLWLHKPYIDDEHDSILESMLIETDLR